MIIIKVIKIKIFSNILVGIVKIGKIIIKIDHSLKIKEKIKFYLQAKIYMKLENIIIKIVRNYIPNLDNNKKIGPIHH